MFKKRTQTQEAFILMSLKDRVPQMHLLRRIKK